MVDAYIQHYNEEWIQKIRLPYSERIWSKVA